MTIDLDKITADVAIILGEPLLPDCEPEEGPYPSLSERVRLSAPSVLGEIMECAPKGSLSEWKSMKGCRIEADISGRGTLILPDDFLMLGSLRLTGWKRPVEELSSLQGSAGDKLSSAWKGIRGSYERPFAFLSTGGGKPSLVLSPCDDGSVIEDGWYMPRPAFDSSGEIFIPDRLYLPFLKSMAALIVKSDFKEL